MGTRDRIIDAATALLDSGGEQAVTLRAVAAAAGISLNAPYKHFPSRGELLAAVASRDFDELTRAFSKIQQSRSAPAGKLLKALVAFSDYGQRNPARYRLLFSDPQIAVQGGEMEVRALATFEAFARIVAECQAAQLLPAVPTPSMTALLYAMAHGLVDLHIGGRMRSEKGFKGVKEGLELMLSLLSKAADFSP